MEVKNENDYSGVVKYQQLMADMLSDRDYDAFEFNQHEFLKAKIAFALFGPPLIEQGHGYDKKQMDKVNWLYQIILKNSNEIAQYKDHVVICFVYNCAVPLPSEKKERAKKYPNYNPNTDFMPVPIFILRKCHGSRNPCRVFIDHTGRVYGTWEQYKNRNKLHECEMILPVNGRYYVNKNGKVLLEKQLSPACGIVKKILQGADYSSMATSLVSGGIFAAAAIPAITVAPVALLVGGIATIGTGIYSMSRSAYSLYDRSKHREGTRAVVDAFSFANVGASGAAVFNSGYDVLDKGLKEEQTPSYLTVVQLTSSILFFGNAVYNFKTCSTVIEETQVRTLEAYREFLFYSRYRRTLTNMFNEMIGQNTSSEVQGGAEVIAAVRNIQNKNDVFTVLNKSNQLMNKIGINRSSVGGDIFLNGVKIDLNELAAMEKKEATSFLSNLPLTEPTPVETAFTLNIVSDAMKDSSITDIESVANIAARLLGFCSGDVKSKVIGALAQLLAKLGDPLLRHLNQIFPNHSLIVNILRMVMQFFAKGAEKLEEQYKNWKKTGDQLYFNPIFPYVNVEKATRILKFFEKAVDMYYKVTHMPELALEELLTYFYNWLASKICRYQENVKRDEEKREHSASYHSKTLYCSECTGYYYVPDKRFD